MKQALRGRWKLTGPDSSISDVPLNNTEPEGAIHIETEGVDADKYVYKMHLGFRSPGAARGGATRVTNNNNNKLVWKGFWSYNRLTDDWAEFGLRNDRAFFWSRVRSYGTGE
jgi:F-box protein 9